MNRPVCFCVYHPSQKLTNFCRNEQCLLPLCPRCVSIHIEDHNHHHTQSMIYTLDYMIQQIREIFEQASKKTKVLSILLLKIQDSKKLEEFNAKKFLKQNMDKIRNQIEKELEKIEEDFMLIINKYGEETIKQLEDIDNLLEQQSRKCAKNIKQIDSDVFLKAIILLEQSNHMRNLEEDIEEISERIAEMGKSKIDINLNWFPLGGIKKGIREIFGYKQHAATASHTPETSPVK